MYTCVRGQVRVCVRRVCVCARALIDGQCGLQMQAIRARPSLTRRQSSESQPSDLEIASCAVQASILTSGTGRGRVTDVEGIRGRRRWQIVMQDAAEHAKLEGKLRHWSTFYFMTISKEYARMGFLT